MSWGDTSTNLPPDLPRTALRGYPCLYKSGKRNFDLIIYHGVMIEGEHYGYHPMNNNFILFKSAHTPQWWTVQTGEHSKYNLYHLNKMSFDPDDSIIMYKWWDIVPGRMRLTQKRRDHIKTYYNQEDIKAEVQLGLDKYYKRLKEAEEMACQQELP